jgi:PHD/YefM family antitoxin component YafN of YafNO toxin-antitoxin module
MIRPSDYISISNLKNNTATIVRELPKWKKIILSQNKPIAVIMSVEEYNIMLKLWFKTDEATKEEIKAYKESTHWKEWVEAFSFLNTLKWKY